MKKSLLAIFMASLSLSAFSGVDVLYKDGSGLRIDEDLKNIRLGNSKYDGEAIGKIIGFINKHKNDVVKSNSPVSKVYFRPHFDGDRESKQGRIYFSKGTASLRLQQAFYFETSDGEKVSIPFDGAEVNAYIVGLQHMDGKQGVVHQGKLLEINSSLVNVDFNQYKNLDKDSLKAPSVIKSSLEDRAQLLDILSLIDWNIVADSLKLDKSIDSELAFKKEVLSNEGIFSQLISGNQEKAKLVFTKDEKGEFILAWRIEEVSGLPIEIDLRADGKGSLIVSHSSHIKHINVNIYTGSSFNLTKKKRRSGDSKVWQHKEVKPGLFKQEDYDIALINLSKVVEYFKATFGWNSFDNKGSDLNATVRFKGSKLFGTAGLRQNAAWAGAPYNQFLFGRGGDTLGDFLNAFDVIGHEYCHAIVSKTSGLDGGGEPGALNEHVCDILGVGFEGDLKNTGFDFKIGELVVLESDKGLRDFLNPGRSFSEQPSHMSQVNSKFGKYCVPTQRNDQCGVHYSNGVPNLAVGLIVRDLGWKRMKDLVFEVVTKKLSSNSDFADYKKQMVRTCQQDSKFSEQDCNLIEKHFSSVGISNSVVSSDDSESSNDSGDFSSQLCEVVMGTCSLFTEGKIYEMCIDCGYKY